MTTVEDLEKVLEETKPPKQLLKYFPGGCAPLYLFNAVVEQTGGKFHGQPFSIAEKYAISQAKRAADVTGDQPRADEVYKNILIGNQYAAEDSVYLAITGVTHLLNPAGTLAEPDCVRPHAVHLEQLGIKLLNLEINDRPGVDISQYFPTTTTWMEEALQGGGKVLVNCWQGASRSATLVLAYLVRYKGMDLVEALRMVKEKRDVRPNNGFLQQLIDYQNECRS